MSIEPEVRYELRAYVDDELVFSHESASGEIIEMSLDKAERAVNRELNQMLTVVYDDESIY